MKTTKTNKQLLELVRSLNATTAEKGSKREVKLKKIAEKIKPIFEQYDEKRQEVRLDNAYCDEKGILELDEKSDYKYTKDGIKKMNGDMKNLLEQTFDFYEFTFSTEGIEDLKFLAGWVEGIEAEKINDDETN
jgi:hypothetical protein